MTYADSRERESLIKGLRALADYLEENTAVPAPIYEMVHAFPPDGRSWAEMTAEIDAVAAMLGTPTYVTPGGHYGTARCFGPVTYCAVAIPFKAEE
jgi:hypothetical protein